MGFIEKRSGRYRARYRDPLGRQRSETFTRKADAERFLREMQVDIERGRWIDPAGADLALASSAQEFLLLARRLSPSTQKTYARDLNRYVLPRFGSYRIGRLPADEIENWLNDEIVAGIAPSSAHRHYRVLRRVLQVAVEKEKIQTNPCDRVQPPRVPKREMVFLTWEEAVDLAEAINERGQALIYLAVDSGMRWSELLGLRRAKVDLNRGKVRVTEQLIRLQSGEWVRKDTKTAAGVRAITISRETAAILGEHVERFPLPGLDSLVFPNTAGNPLISSSFWQHYFKPALDRVGLVCRFHDLRHTSVRSPLPKVPTRRRSRSAWATRRSTSPSTAMATCSRSSTSRDFGDRIAFLTLYVREAHPGDRYPQPETLEQKLEHTRAYRERDQIPWSVAVDDVDGTLHRSLDARPNAAYLIDEQGRVAYRALWSNHERVLRDPLRTVAERRGGIVGESETRVVPMMTGMGKMYEVLSLAGPVARRDVARKLPPMYGLARLAATFRTLPPFSRALLATALAMGGVAVLVAVVVARLSPTEDTAPGHERCGVVELQPSPRA